MRQDFKTCPILSLSHDAVKYMGVNNSTVLCVERECALWDREKQCCAILSIAMELNANL